MSWFRKILTIAASTAIAFSTVGTVHALQFLREDGAEPMILAAGPIVPGDADQLRRLIEESPKPVRKLIIKSEGGSVRAAYELADIIGTHAMDVIAHDSCASACAAIVFLAGQTATLTPGSLLGFHSCYRVTDGTPIVDDLCNEEIAQYAVSRGFAYGSVFILSELRGPSEMYWLGREEAKCMGLYREAEDESRSACPDALIFFKRASSFEYGRPTFDCTKAEAYAEILICKDPALALIDAAVGMAYSAYRKGLNPHFPSKALISLS